MGDNHGGFCPVYMIEVSAERPIEIDDRGFREELAAKLGTVDGGGKNNARLFFLKDFPIQLEDARICAQVAILKATKEGAPRPNLDEAVSQSWGLKEAQERVSRIKHSLLLNDLLSSSLDHWQRRRILSAALRSLLRHSNGELVFFLPTSQFLDASELLGRLDQEEEVQNPCAGFLNVRLFNLDGSDGERVMDTLGLTALGLTDFQVHFKNLDANQVAGVLQSIARYTFEKGQVIENGHTIQGIEQGSMWKIQIEDSLLEPHRKVLDINPGAGFAAGNSK